MFFYSLNVGIDRRTRNRSAKGTDAQTAALRLLFARRLALTLRL